MPDPRPRPRYRLTLIGVFAAFSLALVALGVRLGTAGIIDGADRGPADAGIEPAGAIVDLEAAPAAPEVMSVEAQDRLNAPHTDAATQGGVPRAQVVPPGAGTAASPAPQPPAAALPVPAPGPVPQPTEPVAPPPAGTLLAPVAPVLDALLGGSGEKPPTLPGV